MRSALKVAKKDTPKVIETWMVTLMSGYDPELGYDSNVEIGHDVSLGIVTITCEAGTFLREIRQMGFDPFAVLEYRHLVDTYHE